MATQVDEEEDQLRGTMIVISISETLQDARIAFLIVRA